MHWRGGGEVDDENCWGLGDCDLAAGVGLECVYRCEWYVAPFPGGEDAEDSQRTGEAGKRRDMGRQGEGKVRRGKGEGG